MNRTLTETALEQSIIDVLDRYVTGDQSVTPVSAGATELTVERTNTIQSGQQVEIYDADHAETAVIDCVTSWTTVTLNRPLASDYTAPRLRHLYDGLPIARTYSGDPPVKPQYPTISVMLVNETEEPLTLEDVRHECDFRIMIECETTSYDSTYRMLRTISRRVQNALTRPFTFLVEPYLQTTLAAPVTKGDSQFIADDPRMIGGQAGFILPYATYWIPIFSRDDQDYVTVFQTQHVFTRGFDAGTTIVTPLVNVQNPRIERVEYDHDLDGGFYQSAEIDFSFWIQLNQRRKYDTL